MELRFDHIIHYVDNLKNFKYPGEILKLILVVNITNLEHSIVYHILMKIT